MPTVNVPERRRGGEMYQSDRRLYLNREGQVVEEDDDSRVSLLVGKGGYLTMNKAREHGLVKESEGEVAVSVNAAESTTQDGESERAQPVNAPPLSDNATTVAATKRTSRKAAKRSRK